MRSHILILVLTGMLLLSAGCGSSDGFGTGTVIRMTGSDVEVEGAGAEADRGVITLRSGGRYIFTGTLDQGQIRIETGDEPTELVLQDASISNASGAVLLARESGDVTIILADESNNTITSGNVNDVPKEGGRSAAVDADAALSLGGDGALTVSSYGGSGIRTGGDLTLASGALTVHAAEHGLWSDANMIFLGGALFLTAEGDGLRSDGSMAISGGSFILTAVDDAIRAGTALTVQDGVVRIDDCAKGLCGAAVTIDGGVLQVSARDDGISADGGTDAGETAQLRISGGIIQLISGGNGLCTAGDLCIEGGELFISVPNHARVIDRNWSGEGICVVNGGTLVATGGAGETFCEDRSDQMILTHVFRAPVRAGSTLSLCDEQGNVLLTDAIAQPCSRVVVSAPLLQPGETYQLSADGQNDTVTLIRPEDESPENGAEEEDGTPENAEQEMPEEAA
ncbi:MAG: carbohydrate-binding domain-containing protein [Oscillospiraceae bacterium]|nr:carbohydrate-binding domain-containing protein [Oscillospiraceae bacterium]